MKTYKIMWKILLVFSLCISYGFTEAQEFSKGKYHANAEGLMMEGYDPVSYFKGSKPVKGQPEYDVVYEGVKFLFATRENRDSFLKEPAKYVPVYGGFCAFGMGMDPKKVNGYPQGRYKSSPLSYKLINQKLYLFYPENEWNALKFWNQNEEELKQRADKKWKEIKDN